MFALTLGIRAYVVTHLHRMPAILSINRLQVNGAPLLVSMDQLASFVTETLADAGITVNYTAAVRLDRCS